MEIKRSHKSMKSAIQSAKRKHRKVEVNGHVSTLGDFLDVNEGMSKADLTALYNLNQGETHVMDWPTMPTITRVY